MPLHILPSGRIGADRSSWESVRTQFFPRYARGRFEEAESTYARSFSDTVGNGLPELDAPFRAEFGVDHASFLNIVLALNQLTWNDGQPLSCAVFDEARVRARVAKQAGLSISEATTVLTAFTTEPRSNFLKPPSPFTPQDTWPWRYGRPLSYLRRPLLARSRSGGGRDLVWGPRHLHMAVLFLYYLIYEGRLDARSTEMKRFMSKRVNADGEAFNDKVGEMLAALGFPVLLRVKKIGDARVRDGGEDLGDVDVLSAVPGQRRLLVVECKDLASARTPREYQMEVETLVLDKGDRRSAATKHRRRTDWVSAHVEEALAALNIDDAPAGWSVEPVIVTGGYSLAPLFRTSPMPVVHLDDLPAWTDASSGHIAGQA